MPNQPNADGAAAGRLIADQYAVDLSRPLAGAGGGLPAFAATDRRATRGELMAVQVRPDAPARSAAIAALGGESVDGLLRPLAAGPWPISDDRDGYFVISPAPPGPCLAAPTPGRPWTDADIIALVLRPTAAALDALQARRVTHRAIRLDNLFQSVPGQPVVLGSAWAAPPASLQPAIYEPPQIACCLPAGRGEGGIADDVYALGVTILILALGRVPLAGMDTVSVVRRKLDQGSFAALVGEDRLSPTMTDLIRGMLAEEPEHRSTPAHLIDPAAARNRRVATRPARRAQRPFELGGVPAWTARALAHSIAVDPARGAQALRAGQVDHWLRRSLGDGVVAARLDEVTRQRAAGPAQTSAGEDTRADAHLVARAVAALDPLAPLAWRGVILWPDGLGSAVAAAVIAPPSSIGAENAGEIGHTGPDLATRLEELIAHEAITVWAAARPERCNPAALRLDARQYRTALLSRGPVGGLLRLAYGFNPSVPCGSPLLDGRWICQLADILPALEETALRGARPGVRPLDAHVIAFIASRQEPGMETWLNQLVGESRSDVALVAELRLLARLQGRPSPLAGPPRHPGLAAWLTQDRDHLLAGWRSKSRREAIAARLTLLVKEGQLAAIANLLEDHGLRADDSRGARDAEVRVQAIDAELRRLAEQSASRLRLARKIGHEAAAGLGLIALATALFSAGLG